MRLLLIGWQSEGLVWSERVVTDPMNRFEIGLTAVHYHGYIKFCLFRSFWKHFYSQVLPTLDKEFNIGFLSSKWTIWDCISARIIAYGWSVKISEENQPINIKTGTSRRHYSLYLYLLLPFP